MKLHSVIDVITNSSSSVYVWPQRDCEKKFKSFLTNLLQKLELPTTALNSLKFENTLDAEAIRDCEYENFQNLIDGCESFVEFIDYYPEYKEFFNKYNLDFETIRDVEDLDTKFVEYVMDAFKKECFSGHAADRCGIFNIIFPDGSKIELTSEIQQWVNAENLSWYDE